MAEVRDHRDHEVVKPGTDEGVGLMHECGADGKGCHDFLLVVLEFGRGRPVVIAHLGNGVVVGNIACIVAWLIGHDAIPAEADIWSVVVLIKWWQTAFEAWGALAPWVRSSHVVLVGGIRLPVLVNTSPGSNLRCVQRRVVVLVEALNKFVVVRLIVRGIFSVEVLRHIIECIFHIIVEVVDSVDGGGYRERGADHQ